MDSIKTEVFGRAEWIAPVAALPAAVFGGIVRLRNRLFDCSVFRPRGLPRPVISVGNLTVGGSGKTPLAIHLANTILRLGASPVLLSRGYGRPVTGDIVVAPEAEVSEPVSTLGDEPALIRRRVPPVWLGISRDRHRVGLELVRQCPRAVFILDDGYQHRQLKRDLNILILDHSQPLAGNRIVPRGTLREPLSGARRADVAIVNCPPGKWEGAHAFEESARRLLRAGVALWHCRQQIGDVVAFNAWRAGAARSGAARSQALKPGEPVCLVAAIGNPLRFRRDVLACGFEIKGTLFFRDHFALDAGRWQACARAASDMGASAIITTEKDAVKIRDAVDFPIFVAVQSVGLLEQNDLEERIRALIGSYH